jgi:CRP-like cAMP-binding protein
VRSSCPDFTGEHLKAASASPHISECGSVRKIQRQGKVRALRRPQIQRGETKVSNEAKAY